MRLTDVQWWSSRRGSRSGPILALLVVLVAGLVPLGTTVAAAPVPATAVSQCTRSAGVLVVVDFQSWGDPVDRGCAADPKTGLDALLDAGYSVTGTAQYGDDFICRLDGLPTAKQQSCQSTPPASAYWAYFHALPGQNTWQYSSSGAYGYHPAAGSIEAWTFGSGTPPSFTPGQIRAGSVSTTTTTTSSTTTTVPATTTTTLAPTTTTTRKDAPDSTTTTTRRDTHPKAKAKRDPKRRAAAHFPKKKPAGTVKKQSPPTTALRIVNVAGGAPKAPPSRGGSPTGLIIGVVLALAVAGVAIVTAIRRRRPAG